MRNTSSFSIAASSTVLMRSVLTVSPGRKKTLLPLGTA